MWVVTGPLDGHTVNELNFEKQKLLKPGRSYSLGRLDRDLVVNHRKISHDHGQFIVGSYTEQDAADPTFIPKLEIHNKKKKNAMQIQRAADSSSTAQSRTTITINPSATDELKDGDILYALTEVPLSIRWVRICCYSPPIRGKASFSLDDCYALGISVVKSPNPDITHHLTPTFSVIPSIATSLLSAAQFVKPEWLAEVIRLGESSSDGDQPVASSLEQSFSLPQVTKFRPSFSSSLPPPLKVFSVWEPNEARLNMFSGYLFLFVGEKGREVESEVKTVVLRGRGELDAFDILAGALKWRRQLSNAKRRLSDNSSWKGLILVGNPAAMQAAAGKEKWDELVNEAKDLGLRFVTLENVLEAVVHIDMSYVEPSPNPVEDEAENLASPPLPDFVPNTHPEEPSIPPDLPEPDVAPERPKRLVRRATSVTSSRQPSPAPASAEADGAESDLSRRRPLKRRAQTAQLAIGIDDPSHIIDVDQLDALPPQAPERSMVLDVAAPTPARSSRLKRRAGTQLSVLDSQLDPNVHSEQQEPPLKKFKALFEASDPDKIGLSQDGIVNSDIQPESYGRSDTQDDTETLSGAFAPRSSRSRNQLEVVAEEEEETPAMGSIPVHRGLKRKADSHDHDMAVDLIEKGSSSTQEQRSNAQPPTKKRAIIQNSHAMEPDMHSQAAPPLSSKSSEQSPDAIVAKPDKDVAFLKAVASTKRGKKHEDSFDREFNKLRISKPDLNREEEAEKWAILEDFGEDRNIRGNFMVVVELDVFQRSPRSREGREQWNGRPDFKKFKRKDSIRPRLPVELVVADEGDYGVGSAYWKGHSQSQSQLDTAATSSSVEHSQDMIGNSNKPHGRSATTSNEKRSGSQPATRNTRKPTSRHSVSRYSQDENGTFKSSNQQPLFLDDGIGAEDNHPEIVSDTVHSNDEDAFTLPPTAKHRSQTAKIVGRRKKVVSAVVAEDDSDDDATFKGFRSKVKVR